MSLQSYKDLIVWQNSFQLAKDIYKLTDKMPASEKFALSSQIQRSAVSIPSNIAEGQQRNNIKEYRHFIGIAKGSAGELETQLLLVKDIYGLESAQILKTIQEIQKMLRSLYLKLEPSTSNL